MKTILHIVYIALLANAGVFYLIRLVYIIFKPKFMLKGRLKWFTTEKPSRRELIFYYVAVLILIISGITSVLDRLQ